MTEPVAMFIDKGEKTMRLNNSKYTGLISWGMNIIVYDKKLKEVADTAFLHFENNATVMHRGE